MENKHLMKEPYAVLVNVAELNTSGRRAETARLLLSGMRKAEVIKYLMDTFGMEYKQAHSEYRLAYVYIYQQCELEKEEIRKLNLAKLEELWDRAEEDEQLQAKDYYKTQMKNIDITNKTAGLYDNIDMNNKQAGEFTIDLNLNNKTTENKENK